MYQIKIKCCNKLINIFYEILWVIKIEISSIKRISFGFSDLED